MAIVSFLTMDNLTDIAQRVAYLVTLFGFTLLLIYFCGCLPPARDTTCANVFRNELLACVEKAKTLEESRLCREEVELRWGYPHE